MNECGVNANAAMRTFDDRSSSSSAFYCLRQRVSIPEFGCKVCVVGTVSLFLKKMTDDIAVTGSAPWQSPFCCLVGFGFDSGGVAGLLLLGQLLLLDIIPHRFVQRRSRATSRTTVLSGTKRFNKELNPGGVLAGSCWESGMTNDRDRRCCVGSRSRRRRCLRCYRSHGRCLGSCNVGAPHGC